MPGLLFLFVAWGSWIIATFILDKRNPFRMYASVLSLLLIILQSVSFTLFSLTISASSIPLILTAYLSIYQVSFFKKIYLFFSVMIIMFGYAGFFLFEMYDPVWVLLDRKILLSGGLVIISWVLYPSSLLFRCSALVIGSLHGEVFLSIFLSKWKMPYTIGSADYLDVFALTFSSIFLTHAAGKIILAFKKALEGKLKVKKQALH